MIQIEHCTPVIEKLFTKSNAYFWEKKTTFETLFIPNPYS